jgi:hypothetical protein
MPNRKSFLLIEISLILSFVGPTIFAQTTSTRLRYTFSPGQKLTVRQEESSADTEENLVEGSKSQSTTSKEIAQTWEVESVTKEGDFAINVNFVSLRMRKSLAPSIELVMDTGRPVGETNPALAQLGPQVAPLIEKLETIRKLIADVFLPRTFKLVVSNVGKVKSVTGFDEAWENYRLKVETFIPDKAKRAELDALIEAFFGEDAVNKLFSYTLFVGLPNQNVTVGQEWSDSTEFAFQSIRLPLRRNYKLASVSAGGRTFTIDCKTMLDPPTSTEEVEFKVPGNTLTAQITLDPGNGTVLKQTYAGKIDIEAYGRQPPNQRMILHVVSNVTGSVKITIGQ